MKKKILLFVPLIIFLLAWEALYYFYEDLSIFFSSPSEIIKCIYKNLFKGDLIFHILITAFESFSGLIMGLIVGVCMGFSLVYFPKYSKVTYPYVLALSSVPTFALAPLMIIWFGTGIFMKIMMAFFATVFITAFQTYEGAQKVATSDIVFFKLNHASNKQFFWLLSFPASIDWVIQSLKLNTGFCLMGAFIGEYISSEAGLGFIIKTEGGRYNTAYVFASIICIVILSSIFNYLAKFLIKHKLVIIRSITRYFIKET